MVKEQQQILNNSHQRKIKEKASLKFTIADLTEQVDIDNHINVKGKRDLVQLEESIKEKQAELEKVSLNYLFL